MRISQEFKIMKKLAFIIILIISLIIIKNLLSSIYNHWQKQDLIIQAKRELDMEKKKNKELKDKYSLANSPGFVEEEARNKLFMVKPGEKQIILPPPSDRNNFPQNTAKNVPNWQKWIDLFVK